MSVRHLPLSRSVIVDVLRAIVSRPISNHKALPPSQPLILTWRNKTSTCFKPCTPHRVYSTQASPLPFPDSFDARNNLGDPLLSDDNQDSEEDSDDETDTRPKTKTHKKDKYHTLSTTDAKGQLRTDVKGYKLKQKKVKGTTAADYNRLMMYAIRENRVNKAISLFREMELQHITPDKYSYSMIIHGYSQQSDLTRATKWLNRMLSRDIKPDAHIYTTLIDGYMREANVNKAEKMFRVMMKFNMKPTLVTYNILMHHSVRQLNMESALKFWGNLLEAGLKSDVYTFAIILHGLGCEGRVDEAWRIFKTMQDEKVDVNEVVATTLMGMHVKQHDDEYAIQLYDKFFKNPKIRPTSHTKNVLLNAVISKADTNTIKEYYQEYQNSLKDKRDTPLFVGANVFTYTTFMRAFLRRDDLSMVSQVYADMTERSIQPSLVTYATLMLAHAYVPDPESCNRILNELKKSGIELNAVIYTIVMRAWAKAGRWEKVKGTYDLMKQDNIKPTKLTMEVLRYGRSKSGEI
jgi:pentatricopeptide repeat protein